MSYALNDLYILILKDQVGYGMLLFIEDHLCKWKKAVSMRIAYSLKHLLNQEVSMAETDTNVRTNQTIKDTVCYLLSRFTLRLTVQSFYATDCPVNPIGIH